MINDNSFKIPAWHFQFCIRTWYNKVHGISGESEGAFAYFNHEL